MRLGEFLSILVIEIHFVTLPFYSNNVRMEYRIRFLVETVMPVTGKNLLLGAALLSVDVILSQNYNSKSRK